LGKSKSGFLYPKTDFAFLYLNPKMDKSGICDLKNPHSEWIHQDKSKSAFLGFMIHAFLWGTDPKIVHLSSGLPCKFTGLVIFSLQLAWQNIPSWKRKFRWLFRSVYLKSFLQKYRQTHWHVKITSFVYHFCNTGTRFC